MPNFSITIEFIVPNNFLIVYPEKLSPFLLVFIHFCLIGGFIRFVDGMIYNRVSFLVMLWCRNT